MFVFLICTRLYWFLNETNAVQHLNPLLFLVKYLKIGQKEKTINIYFKKHLVYTCFMVGSIQQ